MPATMEIPKITMMVDNKCLIMSASTSVTLPPTGRSRVISRRARPRFDEVDVGAVDDGRTRQSQSLQKLVSFSNTVLDGGSLRQHHLELHKTAKVLYLVQVDSGPADEEHLAPLDHCASKRQHAIESVDQSRGFPTCDPRILG